MQDAPPIIRFFVFVECELDVGFSELNLLPTRGRARMEEAGKWRNNFFRAGDSLRSCCIFALAFRYTVRYENKSRLGVICKFTRRRGSIGS